MTSRSRAGVSAGSARAKTRQPPVRISTPGFGARLRAHYDEWQGALKPRRVVCKDGHECFPRPNDVQQRKVFSCQQCAGNDPERTQREFDQRVRAKGGEPAYNEWRGVGKPHRVFCKEGHVCFPWPNAVQQGQGICKTCARPDSDALKMIAKDVQDGLLS